MKYTEVNARASGQVGIHICFTMEASILGPAMRVIVQFVEMGRFVRRAAANTVLRPHITGSRSYGEPFPFTARSRSGLVAGAEVPVIRPAPPAGRRAAARRRSPECCG